MLSDMLIDKRLPHPTSTAFSAKAWQTAVADLETPNLRDWTLAAAALDYGYELETLRAHISHLAVVGLTPAAGVRLLAAMANQQYLTLLVRSVKAFAEAPKEAHLENIQEAPIRSAWGQDLAADDLATSLVDTLPHWLFHILRIPVDTPVAPPRHPQAFGARALALCSLEHGLRNLWQEVLWGDYATMKKGEACLHVPRSKDLAGRWHAWHLRQQALDQFELNMDMGARIVAGGRLPDVVPLVPRTVVRVGKGRGGKRTFIVDAADPGCPGQRQHVGEQDMLERLYTGLFLDEALPKLGDGDLTVRELSKAWGVLTDLGRLIVPTISDAALETDKLTGRAAIAIDIADLEATLADAMTISVARARLILDIFTCDPAQTSRIFSKGLWFTPLLPDPGTERRYLLLAPLLVGSTLRRVGYWLELGGISDTGGIKGKGRPYERHVRTTLAQAVKGNALLSDAAVLTDGMKRKGQSEEIDLLARIGNIVLVGEVKCFTRPAEAMEQFNYLRSLSSATEQAARKQAWCEANPEEAAKRLGVTDQDQIATLRFKGVVIVNHSFGVGLRRHQIPIVDLHFLKLLLGHGRYQGPTRFERGVGMTYDMVELYADQADLLTRIDSLLDYPPVMSRYLDAIGWRFMPFQRSDGGKRHIAIPTLKHAPM